jgi:DNA invertase Pin-like site-specific DNA recombinase
MPARPKNHALIYLRRSSDRQEISLQAQLDWALREAERHGLAVDASIEHLHRMQREELSALGSLRIDDGITGADLSRPGFLALIDDATADKSVSHLMIYRRDRLARPEDASKMVSTEKELRTAGITIVFADCVAPAMERGQSNLAEDIAMMLGYYESGDFLRKHSERVIQAQRHLARDGCRTGGNAPYGFVRALCDASGNVVEELVPGRQVSQPGCRVRIVPKDETKIAVWVMILELREKGYGYKRIAAHLNGLGIPSPGAESVRTDHGSRHKVSGKWGPNTVKALCENRAILGLQDYGRRSEGAHRRLGKDGHRLLDEADRDLADRPRTVLNDPSLLITASTGSPAQFDPARWEQLHQQSLERGKSQRGIPRAKDPARFPLSCRIIDLTGGCGAVMYGYKHGGRPLYVCGAYMRSAAALCEHNKVDAEAVLRFTLNTLRELVERRGGREKLRLLLEQKAQASELSDQQDTLDLEIGRLEATLSKRSAEIETAQHRMARESDDARYEALAREFDQMHADVAQLEMHLESRRRAAAASGPATVAEEVEAAMLLFDDITRITTDDRARAEINPMLVKLGLRLGLNFAQQIKGKKRVVRGLVGGVLTFDDSRLGVPLHGAQNISSSRGALDELNLADPTRHAQGGPQGLADKDVVVQGDGSERGDGRIDLSIPGPKLSKPRKRLTESRREVTSFSKVNRGGRI